MKLTIIFPPRPFGWTPIAPPILEYLAALTRKADPTIDIKLIDASATPDIFDTLVFGKGVKSTYGQRKAFKKDCVQFVDS
jgi:hypothetical protein